jgi:hypothetical protein
VYLVAIAEARDVERETPELARLLGVTSYDVKLWFARALPHVVLQTPSRERAEQTLNAIRARGHGALMVDIASIVVNDVVKVKRLVLDDAALGARELPGERLPHAAIGALIRVANRTDIERITPSEPPGDEGSALGWLARGRSRTVVRERSREEHVLEHALYVFPVDGVRPWVIDARSTRYVGLGAAMKPTAYENFVATVELLRERARDAPYDDRFVAAPRTPHKALRARATAGAAEIEHGDPSVHLLALWLMRGRGGPYRDAAPRARAT